MAITKENAKDFLPFIKALSEGKKIEYKDYKDEWGVVEKLIFTDEPSKYRIKPEIKYRPFKSQKECWSEMHKHPDFGWVKNKQWGYYASLGCVGDNIIRSEDECHRDSFDYMYDNYSSVKYRKILFYNLFEVHRTCHCLFSHSLKFG